MDMFLHVQQVMLSNGYIMILKIERTLTLLGKSHFLLDDPHIFRELLPS